MLPKEETIAIDGVGKKTYPAGCPVLLSYANTSLSPAIYKDPHAFAPYEHAAALSGPEAKLNVFNGVGDRGGRICPGRDLALDILINLLEAVRAPTAEDAASA